MLNPSPRNEGLRGGMLVSDLSTKRDQILPIVQFEAKEGINFYWLALLFSAYVISWL